MNKQPMNYVALIVSIGLLFMSACKKDNANISLTSVNGVEQLIKIDQNTGAYSTFDYNTYGLMSQMVTKRTGSSPETLTLSYNANKKIEAAAAPDGKIKFIYDSNKLLNRSEYWSSKSGQDTLLAYTNYLFENNKLVESKMFVKFNSSDIPAERITYAYNNSGDANVRKTYEWSVITHNYELKETAVFEYDDKKNPLPATSELAEVFFQAASVHNPVKKTVSDSQNHIIETDNFTYSYDSKGYPVSQIEKMTKPNAADATIQSVLTYK